MSLPRNKKQVLFLILPGLIGLGGWQIIAKVTHSRAAARVMEYSAVTLRSGDSVIAEDDHFTHSFLDGRYNATVVVTSETLQALLQNPPSWGAGAWAPGRSTNLAKQLDLGDADDLVSVEGADRGQVFRILTIHRRSRRLYFEM